MTLQEAQENVDRWIKEYGVRYFNELTNMAILTEEVGEVARIIARRYGEQSFKESDKQIDLADELADVVVPKVTELSLNDAQDLLKQKGLQWRTVGEGGVVTDQIPAQGASIPGSSQVVLYLGAEKPTDQVPVPDVSGKTLESAQTAFAKVGLYLRPSGSGGSYSSSSTVAVGQSITAGAMVDPGTVVDVQFIDTDIQDYANNTGIR